MEELHEQKSQPLAQYEESEIMTEDAAFVHGEPPQDASGPPKVDTKVEILHEKVTKQIIKEGHGPIPSKYSTCFCVSSFWVTAVRTGSQIAQFLEARSEISIVLGRFLEIQVALPEHVQHPLLGFI